MVLFMEDMLGPPSKCRFFKQLVDHCIFGKLNWERVLQILEGNPRSGTILP
jgi:hypothetical protein